MLNYNRKIIYFEAIQTTVVSLQLLHKLLSAPCEFNFDLISNCFMISDMLRLHPERYLY